MTIEKLPVATHDGTLELGSQKVSCAVLNNGERVLIERSVATAIGRKGGGAYWQKKKDSQELAPILPEYVSAKYLEPYISGSLKEKLLAPIKYINKSGEEVVGINATLLPEICDVWLKARDAGVLKENQIEPAKKADILIRSLARIGITALVDEATGYIKDKKKNEYIDLFKQFIAEEAREWEKEFPEELVDVFYKIYGIKKVRGKNHPLFFSKLINKYIYYPLADSNGAILKMLQEKNPVIISKTGKKYRRTKYFQFLKEEVGLPALRKHIWKFIGVGSAADNKIQLERNFARAFPARNQQLELPLEE